MHYTMPISQRLKKLVKSLHQKQFRDQNGLFIAEGYKLSYEVTQSDYETELVVIKEAPGADIVDLVDGYADAGIPVYTAPKHQFDQMCNTKTPQGIITVINDKTEELNPDEPFIALDGIADPGNLGTIIRTADWFGIKQILLGRDCADKYNPKAVRATMGSIFKTKVIYQPELASFIKDFFPDHDLLGASLNAENNMESVVKKDKYGLLFGSESHGFTKEVEAMLTHPYKIEGLGNAESLNVAVAVGISLYHFAK